MLTFTELKHNLKKDTSNLPMVKVALLGDTATQFLALGLKSVAIERGFRLELFESEFNQIERQFLDISSDFYKFKAEYAIVFQSTHKLLSLYNKRPIETQAMIADERLEFIKLLCNAYPGSLLYCNYPEIDDAVFGSLANKIETSFLYQVRKLNYELMRLAVRCSNLFICDIASIQNVLGRNTLFDSSIYVNYDMVLSPGSIPAIASRIFDTLYAAQGRAKKCLIIDLDQTIWGGIIGDDGLENIQIGDLGIGKAFTELQLWIKKLKERGIIIAVCSKNDEKTAKEPFLNHPDMVLRLEDIAVFMANWENKAENIRYIQTILNIGFDSMVFLDDNPVERALVKENIKDITVPDLPEDPANYLEYLYALNLFETTSYSSVDLGRTEKYQIEASRISSKLLFTNENDFLKSLDMISEVCGFDSFNAPRIAQLSQRSNQFNLRTIRYTPTDIERLAADNKYKHFSFTLRDKFGDNGLVCVVILEERDSQSLFINSWFMSCRVLNRGMEYFTLNTIVQYARKNGFTCLVGEYIATQKNGLVKDHYIKMGFTPDSDSTYELHLERYLDKECYIKGITYG
jgi:FkbH-like protein